MQYTTSSGLSSKPHGCISNACPTSSLGSLECLFLHYWSYSTFSSLLSLWSFPSHLMLRVLSRPPPTLSICSENNTWREPWLLPFSHMLHSICLCLGYIQVLISYFRHCYLISFPDCCHNFIIGLPLLYPFFAACQFSRCSLSHVKSDLWFVFFSCSPVAPVVFMLVLEFTRHAPNSRALHWLFSLPFSWWLHIIPPLSNVIRVGLT